MPRKGKRGKGSHRFHSKAQWRQSLGICERISLGKTTRKTNAGA